MYIFPETLLDICIAISTSVITLFIPLFYSIVIRLDEKYESRLIIKSFWKERCVRWFIISSLLLLVFVIIYSLKLPPIICKNSFLIINSAAIITCLLIFTSVLLGFISIRKLNKYQDPVKLFELTKGLKYMSEKEKRIMRFDLLFHSIKDLNYNKDFTNSIKESFDNEILSFIRNKQSLPVEYYDALEQLTSLVFSNNLNNYTRHNKALVYHFWSVIFFKNFPLSENSYSWLWYHLTLAIENNRDSLVICSWERAHSLMKMKGYKTHYEIGYNDALERDSKSKEESDEFIRFHVALCALLLFSKKDKLLTNCINHTTSLPPDYYLLPKGSNAIIKIFKYFNDPYNPKLISVSFNFSFPGSSGFDQDERILHHINKYLIILLFKNNSVLSNSSLLNVESLSKFECSDYLRILDKLLVEVEEKIDLVLINSLLNEEFSNEDVNKLISKIVGLKSEIISHRESLMSKDPLVKSKIDIFCSSIGTNLSPFLNELNKLNSIYLDKKVLHFKGVKNTVNKDFFVDQSEVSYLDYEKTFSSLFTENLKMNIGFNFQQSTISNYTINSKLIIEIFKDLETKIFAVNFGVKDLENITSNNLIQIGRTHNINPRVFFFAKSNKTEVNIILETPELSANYSNIQPILDNMVLIGLDSLDKGDLAERYAQELQNIESINSTVGIEICADISMFMSDSFHSICVYEHQKYWHSNDPESISSDEILRILNIK